MTSSVNRRFQLLVLVSCVASGCGERKADQATARPPDTGVAAVPRGKRVPPADVPPVTVGALRIEAVHWGKQRGFAHNGGYIAAFDASGKELWTLEVYGAEPNPALESDVQDVFITSIAPGSRADELEVRDEKGRRYVANVQTRTVQRL